MAIKSAYELALERMGKSGEASVKLSEEQKRDIAELERICKARIAEAELRLKPKIAEAEAAGDADTAGKLREELSREVTSARETLESKKEKVRKGGK